MKVDFVTYHVEALLRVAWLLHEKRAQSKHETASEVGLAAALREGIKALARGWLQVDTPVSGRVASSSRSAC